MLLMHTAHAMPCSCDIVSRLRLLAPNGTEGTYTRHGREDLSGVLEGDRTFTERVHDREQVDEAAVDISKSFHGR